MSICNARYYCRLHKRFVRRITNPYIQDIRIANPNGRTNINTIIKLAFFFFKKSLKMRNSMIRFTHIARYDRKTENQILSKNLPNLLGDQN